MVASTKTKRPSRIPVNSARYQKELILRRLDEQLERWRKNREDALQEGVDAINKWLDKVIESSRRPYKDFNEALKSCIQPPFHVQDGKLSYGNPTQNADSRIYEIESSISRINMMADEDGMVVLKDGDWLWRIMFDRN